KGKDTILYGRDTIDISGLEQLVDDSQPNSIAAMVDLLQKNMLNDEMNMAQTADKIYKIIEAKGLEDITSHCGHPGNLAMPRKKEYIAAFNRDRGLKVRNNTKHDS